MTNEEIEKRFMFDLEIGMFKRRKESVDNIISFVGYKTASCTSIIKIRIILMKYGYKINKYSDYFECMYKFNRASIDIDTKNKILYTERVMGNYNDLINKRNYNKLPDYIKRYRL